MPNPPTEEEVATTATTPTTPSSAVSPCGSLRLSFQYDAKRKRLLAVVHEACDIPNLERGGANHTQTRILLLPTRKIRGKTKIKSGEKPQFEETFEFKVPDGK